MFRRLLAAVMAGAFLVGIVGCEEPTKPEPKPKPPSKAEVKPGTAKAPGTAEAPAKKPGTAEKADN